MCLTGLEPGSFWLKCWSLTYGHRELCAFSCITWSWYFHFGLSGFTFRPSPINPAFKYVPDSHLLDMFPGCADFTASYIQLLTLAWFFDHSLAASLCTLLLDCVWPLLVLDYSLAIVCVTTYRDLLVNPDCLTVENLWPAMVQETRSTFGQQDSISEVVLYSKCLKTRSPSKRHTVRRSTAE